MPFLEPIAKLPEYSSSVFGQMDPKIMSWYLLSRPVADDMKGLPRERGHSTPVGEYQVKQPAHGQRQGCVQTGSAG